jgi:dihydrofolate reductase
MADVVALIWAQATNGIIGKDGGIPWHLPEDLANFKALTAGHAVLMGRATWDSLPERFRPLPERRNLVLTRQVGWSADGAEPVGSIADAIATTDGELWVIGGGLVYDVAMPFAEQLVVTEIDLEVDGDTVAPVIDERWTLIETTDWLTSIKGLRYRIARYG